MLKGVDISKWNGSIDFSKLKGQVDFVILRAGYGRLTSQKDERFEEYYAACERYGIPKGCYWASYATSGPEAVQEANAFLSCVKGKKFEYPVMFDYEAFPGYEKQKEASVARAVITNFMNTIKSAGYYVGLYSYYSMFKNCIPSDMQDGRYDIWLAHYASSTPYTGHKMWQYSSKGKLNGVPCEFDMNYCYVDNYPEIIQKGGYNGYTKNGEVVTPTLKPVVETHKIETSKINTNVTSLVAGAKINLNGTNLYASSTTSNVARKLSGSYYVYDGQVVNGRIRITNSADKVGKGMSNVTGWISASIVETKKENTAITAGKEVKLNNTPLYASADATRYSSRKTGTYYVYNNEVIKGRIRITNSADRVGKGMSNVTGWVNVSDIK